MRVIHARERRGDRLELSLSWAWDHLAAALLHAAAAGWVLLGGSAVHQAGALLLLGVALLFLYLWAVGASEAVVLDRRAGELRTARLVGLRRIRTRRPLHLVRRVAMRQDGHGAMTGLVIEVRGEAPVVIPEDGEAHASLPAEAFVARVRAFLAGRPDAGGPVARA